MRDIKFRGKCIDNNTGSWVIGSLVTDSMSKERMAIIDYADLSESDKDGGAIVWNDVVPESVGEYTGMKTNDDIQVFEGDIIKYKVGSMNMNGGEPTVTEHIAPVVYKEYGFYCKYTPLYGCLIEGELIGNIYEHPELLNTLK